MHFDSTGDSLKIGDKVSYPYTQYTLHTGVVLKFGRDHTVISVDKEWWGKNGGRVKDGIKHNNIETEKLTKVNKGQTVEPLEAAAPIKEGDKVMIKSKEDLIAALGADDAGYPKTITRFNTKGEMDHYFGCTGTVIELNTDRGYVELEFDNMMPGLDYGWSVSVDMLIKDDGSYVGSTALREPVRTFMKTNEDPSVRQVWTALIAAKKKLYFKDGTIVSLLGIFATKGIKDLKRIMEYTEEGSFGGQTLPSGIEHIEKALMYCSDYNIK